MAKRALQQPASAVIDCVIIGLLTNSV